MLMRTDAGASKFQMIPGHEEDGFTFVNATFCHALHQLDELHCIMDEALWGLPAIMDVPRVSGSLLHKKPQGHLCATRQQKSGMACVWQPPAQDRVLEGGESLEVLVIFQ